MFLIWELLAVICPIFGLWYLTNYFRIWRLLGTILDRHGGLSGLAVVDDLLIGNGYGIREDAWPASDLKLSVMAYLVSVVAVIYNLQHFLACNDRHNLLTQQIANLKKKEFDGKKVVKARKIVGSCLNYEPNTLKRR